MSTTKNYHGIPLMPMECVVLEKIEKMLNEQIPHNTSLEFGFYQEEAHVIRLNLRNKRITQVPPTINCLKKLKRLNVDQNLLKEIPKTIGSLHYLEDFLADGNELLSIPDTIGNCQALKTLYLANNKIWEIPQNLKQLKNLEIIDLTNNQVRVVPPQINLLTKIRLIKLDHNLLTELAPAIGEIKNLEVLTVRSNKLTTLPDTIVKLSDLQILDFRENPSISLSSSVIEHLSRLEKNGCIVLGATYKSPLENREYWFGERSLTSEEDLLISLEKTRKKGENIGGDEEPIYKEISSPRDDYLRLGFGGADVLIDYDAHHHTITAGSIPYVVAVEVALEFYRTGRLSPKVDWQI